LADKIAEKYNRESVKDKVILKALTLMHENLGKKQLISEIASECYLSTNGFIRRFKKEIGETPYSYLKKLKVRTAQNMRMSGATLDEIAEKCGYSDSSALLHAIGNTTISH
jgi:transcriptional regulator GlxA family with amidase domain